VLLTGLDKIVKEGGKKNIFIVLHIAGSHGPTYYKKYPKSFEVFKPVCMSVDLQKCTKQELVNAYDNSIRYTDYFLSRIIKILKNNDEAPSLLVYASDHGESLGEYGFYLHGTPYAIAPDYQKKIPFLLWASSSFKKDHGIGNNQYHGSYSQKNIFHTVMGAFHMTSPVYNKNLDILQNSPGS
jgi:lipid A ethanolaminephosphotransferase